VTPGNVTSEWASLLVDTLAGAGITDVVISPGSRSTPLVCAALRNERLRAHRFVDERSAAFFAVGQAKMTGLPALLICTSGTAGAHYYPAVIEAARTRTPLVILTADRPGELQGTGAPQTMDQRALYGSHARAFIDLGLPDHHHPALRALRGKALRAYGTSLFPTPGPVHVNVPFRKPLEPQSPETEEEQRVAERVSGLRKLPLPETARPAPDEHGVERAVREIARIHSEGETPMVACGPESSHTVEDRNKTAALLAALPFPVFTEATSQLRFGGVENRTARCDGFDTFLRSPRIRARKPGAIIRIGAPLASKGWEMFSGDLDVPHFVVAPFGWDDPHGSGALFVRSSGEYFVQKLSECLAGSGETGSTELRDACRKASVTVANVLGDMMPGGEKAITQGAAARTLLSSLPVGSLLALSNSLPVRDVDMFGVGCSADLMVWSQRGVNGIDGLMSGAAGAASASGRPTTLYVGDVAFLHDLGGLAVARRSDVPFVIVVANNGGGRIFEQLPIARDKAIDGHALEWWTTPPGIELSKAADLFGITFEQVRTSRTMGAAIANAHNSEGCTIIEVVIDPATIVTEQECLRETVFHALEKADL